MNNNYLKNIIVSGLPGVISIFLSFFSIPLYLNLVSADVYANFLIQHFILSMGMFLNLNLGKFASIKIQKINEILKKKIIFTTISISFILGIIISSFIYYLIYIISLKTNFIDLSISLFFGLVVTILFINVEFINKGLGYFKICSFLNFIFYGVSLSTPAFFLLVNNNSIFIENMFLISLYIKYFSFFFLFLILVIKRKFIFTKIDFSLIKDFRNHSKWMTITGIYNQIYDYIDKHLIKINLSSLMLITYSVPQQLAGKLTIFSQSIIVVLLPRLSTQKNELGKRNVLTSNIYFFFILMSLFLLATLPFYDEVLNWWLKKSYSEDLLKLFKIFIPLTFLSCLSSIIISFYEATLIAKKNTKYETISIIPFIIGLIICVYFKNIFLFAILLFLKEFILIFVRIFSVKNYIVNFKYFNLYIIVFILAFVFSIFGQNNISVILSLVFLILLSIKTPYHLVLKEFFKSKKFRYR